VSKKFHFSPYSKPYAPSKPQEMITQWETISESRGTYDMLPIPAGADHVEVEILDDYGDYTAKVTFSKSKQVPNPNYEKQMARYKEDWATYKQELKEWKKLKKEWDEQQAKEKLESKKKLYEQLKKELEGEVLSDSTRTEPV